MASDDASAPTARPAATVVVVRERDEVLEVILLRRSASSRFAPRFAVFPGGVVEDGDENLAWTWFGSPEDLDRACAVRELHEEAGLSLGPDGLVHGGRDGLGPARLPVDALPEIARWVAPDFLPIRFDARFFAARAAPDAEPHADGVEIESAWWTAPGDALDEHGRGELSLMWPTLKMLEAMVGCRRASDVFDLRVEQVAPPAPPAIERSS